MEFSEEKKSLPLPLLNNVFLFSQSIGVITNLQKYPKRLGEFCKGIFTLMALW